MNTFCERMRRSGRRLRFQHRGSLAKSWRWQRADFAALPAHGMVGHYACGSKTLHRICVAGAFASSWEGPTLPTHSVRLFRLVHSVGSVLVLELTEGLP